MQIKNIDVIKALQQAAAHAAESRIIQVAVTGDKGQDAMTCLFNMPLRKAYEFYIVVTQPFCLSRLLQFWAAFLIAI